VNRLNRALCAIYSCALIFFPIAANADEPLQAGDGTQSYAFPAVESPWQALLDNAIARVINGDDYVCSAPTALDDYVVSQLNQIDVVSFFGLAAPGAFNAAANMKILFDQDASDEYIGLSGEFTREQIKRHKDNQRFWDVPTDDILLMGMHGNELTDTDTVINTLLFFGLPLPIAEYLVDTTQTIILGGDIDLSLYPSLFPGFPPPLATKHTVPGIPGGYSNPLFTLNAFAFSTRGAPVPGIGIVPDKIVMGEGLLEAITAIGLGINGPDYIHAHEFAHHVQLELGVFGAGPPTPEGTRRTELMADGFGAYYASHARGSTFQAKRFADVMTSAFVVGDCGFASPGHHGTHLQREAAAEWGGSVVKKARKKGHIESAANMLRKFDAVLPELVAPDAP